MNYTQFFTVRVVAGILIAAVALFGLWAVLNKDKDLGPAAVALLEDTMGEHGGGTEDTGHDDDFPFDESADEMGDSGHDAHETAHETGAPSHETPAHEALETAPGDQGGPPASTAHGATVKGVTFVEAAYATLDSELNNRSWGWRANDLLPFTDNVEHIQRGVLEVVRRTCVALAERISRYGPTDVIDHNLENAMNWLMIKPDQYWLPSPEDKYNEAIKELRAYAERLEKGETRFYTRADNLIPLLLTFADLLGSCDDNLVKTKEEDGSSVSSFKTDDYFYYAKGVAMALGKILHAVEIDFAPILEARGGMDLLEHAIHSLHQAAELDPWLVTNGSLDGFLANHRANMAAPISHARHYLDALAKTLST
jgi:hypothetical protein